MKKSKLFSIGWKDVGKAAITTATTSTAAYLYQVVSNGGVPSLTDLKTAGSIGLFAGIGYLLKNLGTNSDDQFLKKEQGLVAGNTNPDDTKNRPPKP